MSKFIYSWFPFLLLGILLVMLGVSLFFNEEEPPGSVPSEISVDGPDADTKVDDKLSLSVPAKEVVREAREAPERFDLGGNLRGDDPTKAGVLVGPLAAQEWPGCKTAFVRSFSQRTAPIRAIGLHYTAGSNRKGWADLDGLTAYSNNPRNQVSWHFAIDRESNCTYNVPLKYKAWTIGNLNSQTVNIEMVGLGNDSDYAGAGHRRLSAVVRRIGRLHNIPIRLGATDGNCNVTKRGLITHWMGGSCSGGHHDIKPYDLQAVVRRIAADACGPLCKRRKEHTRVHARLRELGCSRPSRRARHPNSCRRLSQRNRELHRQGI